MTKKDSIYILKIKWMHVIVLTMIGVMYLASCSEPLKYEDKDLDKYFSHPLIKNLSLNEEETQEVMTFLWNNAAFELFPESFNILRDNLPIKNPRIHKDIVLMEILNGNFANTKEEHRIDILKKLEEASKTTDRLSIESLKGNLCMAGGNLSGNPDNINSAKQYLQYISQVIHKYHFPKLYESIYYYFNAQYHLKKKQLDSCEYYIEKGIAFIDNDETPSLQYIKAKNYITQALVNSRKNKVKANTDVWQSAYDILYQIGAKPLEITMLYNMAVNKTNRKDIKRSDSLNYAIVDFCEKNNIKYSTYLGLAYRLLAEHAFNDGDYKDAIEYTNKVITIFEKLDNNASSKHSLNRNLFFKSKIYNAIEQPDSALSQFRLYEKYIRERENTQLMPYFFIEKSEAYRLKGEFNTSRRLLDSALVYAYKSENDTSIKDVMLEKAMLYYMNGQTRIADEVFENYFQSTNLTPNQILSDIQTNALFFYSKIMKNRENYGKSATHAKIVIDNAKHKTNYSLIVQASQLLAEIEGIRKNYKEQARYLHQVIEYKEKANKSANLLEMGRLESEFAYQSRLKEEKLSLAQEKAKLLQEEKKSIAMAVVAIILCGIAGILLFILYRRNKNFKQLALTAEKEKMERKYYEDLDKLRRRIFINISHDFRTPLTLIKEPILSLMNDTENKNKKKVFKSVISNVDTLLLLVNQLIQLSKIKEGKQEISFEHVDIRAFMLTLINSFESYTTMTNVNIHARIPKKETLLYTEKESLKKILHNLISNGIRNSQPNDTVFINLKFTAENYVFDIIDEGMGLDSKEVAVIFERYRAATETEDDIYKPGGLDLSIVYELVQLLNGDINVQSQVNEGSTFSVIIPYSEGNKVDNSIMQYETIEMNHELDTEEEEELNALLSGYTEVADKNKLDYTILIVEDNKRLLSYLHSELKDEYNIITAIDGKEALLLANEHVPDIIITDVVMPNVNGINLVENLMRNKVTNHIPIIFMSMIHDNELQLKMLQTGAIDFITKPISLKLLKVKIENILQLQKNHIQNNLKVYSTGTFGNMEDDMELENMDKKFITEVFQIVSKYMSDSDFSVTTLAQELSLSRSQLFKKLKKIIGITPSQVILDIRMKKAHELLEKNVGLVNEIGNMVGYSSPSHFSKSFNKYFGYPPSQLG